MASSRVRVLIVRVVALDSGAVSLSKYSG
jgi:hypothetical protein